MQITSIRLILKPDVANVVTELWTKPIQQHHDPQVSMSRLYQGGSCHTSNSGVRL